MLSWIWVLTVFVVPAEKDQGWVVPQSGDIVPRLGLDRCQELGEDGVDTAGEHDCRSAQPFPAPT